MPVYAVTGGAGFIGSHIAEALSLRGDTVRVLDNFSTGKRRNIETFESHVDVREVDLASETGLASHLRGVDYVIHQAAIPSVPRSMKDPVRSHEANVNGTLNLLVACREAGVRRVIYASSSSLYGESEVLPKHEEMAPRPMSPYGGQKLFGEVYCQVFWRAYGLETVSLRKFNVFGPRQDASSAYSGVLARFIPAVLGGKEPRYLRRRFAVEGFHLCIERRRRKHPGLQGGRCGRGIVQHRLRGSDHGQPDLRRNQSTDRKQRGTDP